MARGYWICDQVWRSIAQPPPNWITCEQSSSNERIRETKEILNGTWEILYNQTGGVTA